MIRSPNRPTTFVAALALTLFAFASAQDRNETPVASGEFTIENVRPFGDLTTSYEPYDSADAGAIVLTHSTPSEQHANFDVVGPYDFWQHFDFSDDAGAEYVLDDLAPGYYSVAATDNGLGLVHTVVEVRAGEAVVVDVVLTIWEEGWTPGSYDPYSYYGTYADYEDAYPGYPYGAYDIGLYNPYGAANVGALAIEDVPEGTDVVVTGPDGFSEAYESSVVIEDLVPGVYAVAASGETTDLAVTTVEIQAAQQLPLRFGAVSLQGGESD